MAKKKTLRQQDFVKKKLKVGKAKQKPSNVIDTSFVSKTIHLPNQIKLKTSGDPEVDIIRRVSLCRHHSSVARKETLAYFATIVPQIIHGKAMSQLLNTCIPLICDVEKEVREELLKLFDAIGAQDPNVLRLNLRPIVLFINNAMTHIVSSVQHDSSRFLTCIMQHAGDELVRLFWIKLLKGMFNVLGWGLANNAEGSSKSVSMNINSSNVVTLYKNKRFMNQHIHALTEFVRLGCFAQQRDNGNASFEDSFYTKYLLPQVPQPYAYLKLSTREFGSIKLAKSSNYSFQELDTLACEDISTRRNAFLDHFCAKAMYQLPFIIKDGGELGRSAATLINVLQRLQPGST